MDAFFVLLAALAGFVFLVVVLIRKVNGLPNKSAGQRSTHTHGDWWFYSGSGVDSHCGPDDAGGGFDGGGFDGGGFGGGDGGGCG